MNKFAGTLSAIVLLAASPAAAATVNLGAISIGTPVNQIATPAVGPFQDFYNFSLSSNGVIGGQAGPINISLGILDLYKITGFTVDLVGGSLISTGTGSWQTSTLAANTPYQIKVSGNASGAAGGLYSLSMAAAAAPVPGPAGLLVAAAGAGLVAYRRRRATLQAA